MPIIKSAKKRVRVARKATVRNSKTKRSLKSALKTFRQAVSTGEKKAVAKAHSKSQSELDKAAKKGLLHKNKVARQKSRLAAAAKKAAGVAKTAPAKAAKVAKPAAKKAPAKKPVAKKATTVKKTVVAKKPAAKKVAAKKPAAKK